MTGERLKIAELDESELTYLIDWLNQHGFVASTAVESEATMSEVEVEAVWAMVRSAAQVLDTVSDMLERVLERGLSDD